MKLLLLLLAMSYIVLASPFGMVFKPDERIHQLAEQVQRRLSLAHGAEPEADKVRKCEITISGEGFLRHRKTYITGKQEYYSLNLSRLKSVDYYGTIKSGRLTIQSQEDDVIVQTYNDRSGNVDSMAVRFDLLLGNVEPEDISGLQRDLLLISQMVSP